MRIAIDARMYGTAQRGIGRYLMKLIENLETISSLRDGSSSHQFTIFLRRANFKEYQPKNPNFKKALWDVPWYGWSEQVSGVRCQVSGIDLFHFPHWNVPLFFNKPFVVTIHDLQLFSSSRVRESTTRGRLIYAFKFLGFKIIFRHAVLTARAIIVPSNYVREQLLTKYPRLKERVRVIYEAATIDGIRNYESGIMGLVNDKYVLYVGAAYPHKNLERLLKAWNIIHEKLPDYKLILVGREDFFWKQLKKNTPPLTPPLLLRRIRLGRTRGGEMIQFPPMPEGVEDGSSERGPRGRGGVGAGENNIVFYDSATDDELAALYQNASLLIQPSLEEGFSLTPLEALSFDCPVAVSDIPVHREILQDCAEYFDPQDESTIAQTIKNCLKNGTPQHNLDKLLSRYSWKEHAVQTLHLYTTAKKV